MHHYKTASRGKCAGQKFGARQYWPKLRHKLLTWKEQLLPKHPMAEAVHYKVSQWEELTVFTRHGAVPIDNNVSEREMKRAVLNRKNSLFVGNPRKMRFTQRSRHLCCVLVSLHFQ
jgi:hypothetical protein